MHEQLEFDPLRNQIAIWIGVTATALFGLVGPRVSDAIPERLTAPLMTFALALAFISAVLKFRHVAETHKSKHLQINAASQELVKHWSDDDLAAYDNAPVRPVEAALQALEDFALNEKVKIYEKVAQERLREITPERYKQLKGSNLAYFPQDVYFLRRELGPAWRRYMGRSFVESLLARITKKQ